MEIATAVYSPREAAARLSVSKTTLWRLSRRGDLPQPIQLSPGRIGWRAADLEAWLAARQRPGVAAHVE